MPDLKGSIPRIVTFLTSRCGLREVKVDPRMMPVVFDALLAGPDPLTVVAVEQKQKVGPTALHEVIRKAESFVWSAYTNNKLVLLNLVILLPSPLTMGQLSDLEKQLSGTARIFIVTESMPLGELEANLSLLASPQLISTEAVRGIGGTISTILGDIDPQFYEELTKGLTSEDELTSRIAEHFRSLSSEVDRAT